MLWKFQNIVYVRIRNKLVKVTVLTQRYIATILSEACSIQHVGQQCCVKIQESDILHLKYSFLFFYIAIEHWNANMKYSVCVALLSKLI